MKRFALLALVAALLAGCGTASVLRSRAIRRVVYSTVADVVSHRFVHPFELDGGGLRVLPPPPSYRSHRTVGSVEQEALATWQIGGLPVPVGLGVVTITRHVHGIPVVRRLIAWIALGEESGIWSCGAFVRYPRHPLALPSPDWVAVVIGDAPHTPALYYQSASDHCGPVVPTSVQRATEIVSVPWTLVNGTVEADVPTCSTVYGSDFSFTRISTTFQHLVLVTESNDTSNSAIAVPRGCSRHQWLNLSADPEAGGVGPSTIHGPIGPLSQIGTPYYLRGPVQTSAAVIAAEKAKKR